jgi:type IV pilus assembly protein PilC
MAKFLYTAKGYDGKAKGGEIVAKDEQSAVAQIKAEGFLVTSIQESTDDDKGVKSKFNVSIFSSVPLKEKMVFARNLSVMVESGLSIGKALENLSVQVQNKAFKKVLSKMHKDVQAGKSLSEAMADNPNVFNELFVNMVRVGEIGGNLEEVLRIVAVQLEKENALKSKVRGAMMYPAVIIVAMMGVAVLMLTYILPKITGVFADMDVELPASTQFIVDISDLLRNNILLILGVVIIGGIAVKLFLRTDPGKKALSFVILYSF